MTTEIFKNEFFGETYSVSTLKNGLKIYVMEKPEYSSAYAVFGTKYGSIDIKFRTDSSKDFTEVPAGIAHFLEHKLFESEEGDAFLKFGENGAYANAYTSFDRTGYLFSCTDEFESNLTHLLSFVSDPYFTEETVAKEQGIIGQEIKMYDDSPDWRVFFNMLTAVYHFNPVRTDIAGTVESIAQITPELLYSCYNTFYHPSNMFLCVAGNVKTEKVLEIAEKVITTEGVQKIESYEPAEPQTVKEAYCEQQLDVSKPIFNLGFKQPAENGVDMKTRIATELLLDVMAGSSSDFYNRLVKEGLINPEFSFEHFTGRSYSVIIFSGESSEPEKVAEEIKKEILRLRAEGIPEEDFILARQKSFGQSVMMFNSVEGICQALTECAIRDEELFSIPEIYSRLEISDLMDILNSMDEERSSLSVVKPIRR